MITQACCEECGAPFDYRRKWDGGRNSLVAFPTCACEETKTDERVDRMIERIKRRREGMT